MCTPCLILVLCSIWLPDQRASSCAGELACGMTPSTTLSIRNSPLDAHSMPLLCESRDRLRVGENALPSTEMRMQAFTLQLYDGALAQAHAFCICHVYRGPATYFTAWRSAPGLRGATCRLAAACRLSLLAETSHEKEGIGRGGELVEACGIGSVTQYTFRVLVKSTERVGLWPQGPRNQRLHINTETRICLKWQVLRHQNRC